MERRGVRREREEIQMERRQVPGNVVLCQKRRESVRTTRVE
jgi:hypothetical protein